MTLYGLQVSIAIRIPVLNRLGIMKHDKSFSQRLKSASLLSLAGILAACASSDEYPSFAIPIDGENAGRVAMRFPGVNVPEPRPAPTTSEQLPAELDAYLTAINTRASAANNAFSRDLASTRLVAEAASAAGAESDQWTNAQVRLADLTTFHSRGHIALADLDALAARSELTQSSPSDEAAIKGLRAELSEALDRQARALADINALLAR